MDVWISRARPSYPSAHRELAPQLPTFPFRRRLPHEPRPSLFPWPRADQPPWAITARQAACRSPLVPLMRPVFFAMEKLPGSQERAHHGAVSVEEWSSRPRLTRCCDRDQLIANGVYTRLHSRTCCVGSCRTGRHPVLKLMPVCCSRR